MKKVIRQFKALNKDLQSKVYYEYTNHNLEKTVFPLNGKLVEGVIYSDEKNKYLIPVLSIIEYRKDVYQDLFQEEDLNNVNGFDIENEE